MEAVQDQTGLDCLSKSDLVGEQHTRGHTPGDLRRDRNLVGNQIHSPAREPTRGGLPDRPATDQALDTQAECLDLIDLARKKPVLGLGESDLIGQLGLGNTDDPQPSFTPVMTNVSLVATNGESSFFLKNDGSLWATGVNDVGQLGDGTLTDQSSPVQVMTGVAAVSAGNTHTMILKTDGTLWATGTNLSGELGDGTTTPKSTPVQVMTGVAQVAAGNNLTVVLKTDGSLWATGLNSSGQLGTGNTTSSTTFVRMVNF